MTTYFTITNSEERYGTHILVNGYNCLSNPLMCVTRDNLQLLFDENPNFAGLEKYQ